MACSGMKRKVSPVRRATPMVAVRPGSMPTMMPNPVAQKALKMLVGFISSRNSENRTEMDMAAFLPQGRKTAKIL